MRVNGYKSGIKILTNKAFGNLFDDDVIRIRGGCFGCEWDNESGSCESCLFDVNDVNPDNIKCFGGLWTTLLYGAFNGLPKAITIAKQIRDFPIK